MSWDWREPLALGVFFAALAVLTVLTFASVVDWIAR